eukprot:COSAG02_NODE_56060_length_287_cov_0.829787_1_plen_57_part_01
MRVANIAGASLLSRRWSQDVVTVAAVGPIVCPVHGATCHRVSEHPDTSLVVAEQHPG